MGTKELRNIDVEEISLVDVPAVKKKFIIIKNENGKSFAFRKAVIPYKEMPKAPMTEDWDAGKETREAEVADLKIMCAWFDSDKPDIKGSYKLPHHKLNGYALVWRGVAAAMGALLGARGGVDIPTNDRLGVYNHLAKHYKEFDKEPPVLKRYTEKEWEEFMKQQDDFQNKNNNKREVKKMDELTKLFKEVTGKELSEKQIETLKTIPEEKLKELNESLDVVKGYKSELPEELNKSISYLTGLTVQEQPEAKVAEITEEQKAEIIEEFTKTGKKFSKETLDVIKGVIKALIKLLPEEERKGLEKAEAIDKDLEKKEEEINEKIKKAVEEANKVLDGKLSEKDKKIEELEKRLKTVEDVKGAKKSLEEEEPADNKEIKKEFRWKFIENEE